MRSGQIIVTGASKGIGAGIAVDLVRRGFSVVSLSRSGTAEAGRAVACDVTDEAALARAIEDIAAEGPIIGLVNNAGALEIASTATLSAADFERTMRLNATSVLVACREVQPHLADGGGGLIVNIGSFFEKLGVADSLAYCASKAAVGAMTRCLAVEWATQGIRVLNVAPGYIVTDLNRDYLASNKAQTWLARRIPVQRAGRVDEVAKLVGALFVEDIAFLTGETILIDGAHGINH